MKKFTLKFFTIALLVNAMGCDNSQQNSHESTMHDITTVEPVINKTKMIAQKITPCLWVETTDAKAVVDYYLSIFKDGVMKEHHRYTNPQEAGGTSFETAIIEIA